MDAQGAQSPVEFVNLQLQSPVEIQQPPHQSAYQPWNSQQPEFGGTKLAIDGRVLKEPIGFIKIIEFIFSILAFATTSGFSTYFAYTCSTTGEKVHQDYSYPFRLKDLNVAVCNGNNATGSTTMPLMSDFSSQSQYFVASGVLAFLYSLAAIIFYILNDKMYHSNPLIPMADFCLTVVMAVFWLTSSSAWAQGLADLKYFSNPINFSKRWGIWCKTPCVEDVFAGSFATLNVSVLVGFVNFVLWAANLWFVYKETAWFLNRGVQQNNSEQQGQGQFK